MIEFKIEIDSKNTHNYDYFLLMKFLVANEFNVTKAVKIFTEYINWR